MPDRLNRIASQCLWSALRARGWTESSLAKESGLPQSMVSMQLAGKRPIKIQHLNRYLNALNHWDGKKLLVAWIQDNLGLPLAKEFLNAAGNDLSDEVKAWTPPLDEEDKRMLAWWAREIERDGELEELFKLLSARAGYRPTRTAAGPVKRKRRC